MTELVFPAGFRWGSATSSFQIEGAADVDGRTPSIWDTFCDVPGAIANGDDGRLGVDHYHRYAEDVAVMAALGLDTYRFSVSWSRVMNADGTVNRAGMDFYSRLVDELGAAGIEPWLTLFHWDLPEFLPGGWLNRDTAARFADYATAVHDTLGDRVRIWTTLNEPWCASFVSYGAGEHAPGHTDPVQTVRAAHHLMLAHGWGTQALRAADAEAKLGITLNFGPVGPLDPDNPGDVDQARRIDGTVNRFFLEAVVKGAYPSDVLDDFGLWWDPSLVADGDAAAIATPIDLLGINYYATSVVRAPRPGEVVAHQRTVRGRTVASPHITAPDAITVPRDLRVTSLGWEIDPDGLEGLLLRLQRDYTGPAGIGLVITENGAAFADQDRADDQTILDLDRLDYLRGHLAACHRAISAGVDLRGYLVWSLMDNFEWAHGYGQRFGILAVDSDLRRQPKASALWYADLARSGRLIL